MRMDTSGVTNGAGMANSVSQANAATNQPLETTDALERQANAGGLAGDHDQPLSVALDVGAGQMVDVVAAAADVDTLSLASGTSSSGGSTIALPDIEVAAGASDLARRAHLRPSPGLVAGRNVLQTLSSPKVCGTEPAGLDAGWPDAVGYVPETLRRNTAHSQSCKHAVSFNGEYLKATAKATSPKAVSSLAASLEPTEGAGGNKNSVVVVEAAHFTSAFKALEKLYRSQQLCDVVLSTEGREVAAHRVVLAAASPYFQAMFTTEMLESRLEVIQLNAVPAACVQALVDFAYTGTITVDEDNVQLLLPAAGLLQMPPVVEGCCSFLRQQLDCSNCLGIARFADMHGCVQLKTEAERYAREHYAVIATKSPDEFLDMSCDYYCELISSNELNVLNEETLLIDVLRWVRHDAETRQQYLQKILARVRLVLLPPLALVKLGMMPEVRSCERCRDLVDEAKNFLLLPDDGSRIAPELTQPRQPLRSAVLYAVGGWCTGEALADVERYDWPNDEWGCVASMSKKRCGVGLAAVGPSLYALGGHDGTHYLNSIERYDPRNNTWTPCPVSPRCEVRTSVGIGVIDDRIYAVGGQDGISCLDMTECYHTKTGQWSRKAPMSERRLGVAVVVLNGLLYAIGGADGGVVPLRTAERYDPATNCWRSIAPMWTKRKHHGAAPLGNHIYVAGGRDEHSELNSVECYNPITNSWRMVANMTSYRSGVGLTVLNNRIFAVGGFNGSTYLRSVEYFNEEADEWVEVSSMNNRRLGGGVAVIQAAFSAPAPSPQFKPMPGLS